MEEKKITIYDIAEKTRLSAVTVHRALNNKGRISPKTKQLILNAARELGYKANPAAQGLRRAPIKLGAILFCPVEEYVDHIIEGIHASGEALEKYNVSVEVCKIPYTDSKTCLRRTCERLRQFAAQGVQGMILFASSMLDEVGELAELMRELTEQGLVFATVANDIPGVDQAIHVGINAKMAGSMAAQLLSFSCTGAEVALLTTGSTSPVNMEYIDGFMAYADVFSAIHLYEHFDDPEKVAEVTRRMLAEHPTLGGIYMTTASSALACRCVAQAKTASLSIITTDLLDETPALLKNKIAAATVFQNPYKQGKTVVRALYHYITAGHDGGVHLITPHILLSSNLEAYLF